MRPSRIGALVGCLLCSSVPVLMVTPAEAWLGLPGSRADEPVLVTGAGLPEFVGTPIANLALYRVDAGALGFAPVPFQVDERLVKVFEEGTPLEFTELMYDVFGDEDGVLDADDELAFYFGDAGPRATEDLPWPDGAGELRFEIRVEDPSPEGGQPARWVYLFEGPGLAHATDAYVAWDKTPVSTIVAGDLFALDYEGNWLLTGYRVFAPCGDDTDLIDRFKGRAEPFPDLVQDEEDWNGTSEYLGGIAGPVRAIRYVRGARSGVNTTYHDVVYRAKWYRTILLRVHELVSLWSYFDWLPQSGAVLFTNRQLTGIVVDGVPDAGIGTEFAAWHLMRTDGGGALVFHDVPSSPLYSRRELYYVDDDAVDDTVLLKEGYGDDDDSAYGAHGVKIVTTLDSNTNPIRFGFEFIPLCAGEGDPEDAVDELEKQDFPLDPTPRPEADCAAIREMVVRADASDVALDWDPVPQADAYRVYASDLADLSPPSWTTLGETVDPAYRDDGAAASPDTRFYSVTCVRGEAEGPW